MKWVLIWLAISPATHALSGVGWATSGTTIFANEQSCQYAAKQVDSLYDLMRVTCVPYDVDNEDLDHR